MRVQFEYTQADLVDANTRLLRRSNLVNVGSWKSSIFPAVIVGAIAFLILRNDPMVGMVVGLVGGLIVILSYPKLQKSAFDSKLQEIAAKVMAEPGPHVCEVELRPDGVWARQMNKQIIYEWKIVEAVEEVDDTVTIYARDGGGVVIRNRAFKTEDQRSRFLELARSGVNESRNR
jgi:YcxB-like protein